MKNFVKKIKISHFVNKRNVKYFFFPCAIGVRCQQNNKFALAAIDERGAKRLRCGKSKTKFVCQNIPFLRGIIYFFAGICALFATFWDSGKISEPAKGTISEKVGESLNIKRESVTLSVLLVLGLGLSIFLFGLIPSRLSFVFIGMSMNFALRNFLIALTKVAIFFVILLILRFIPMMQDLYRFNGACNQVRIRDGSSVGKGKFEYFAPLNILNIVVFTFVLAIFVITCVGVSGAWYIKIFANLGLFLLCVMASYEICFLLEKKNWLRFVGCITDFFVSAKPSITHDEIARVALNEAKLGSGESVGDKNISYSSLLTQMQTELEKAGKYDKADVEWIIATVMGVSRAEAKLIKSFSPKQEREIMKATMLRAAGKPLSAIFGFVEFYGLRFDVNKKVLSPRMETEILVEQALAQISNKKLDVLDLGTGSGAIAISIAKFSKAKVTAVDISKAALGVAKTNAEKNGVKIEFVQSDLFNGLKNRRKFDIIISNPPYIRSLDINGLDDEVKNFDPRQALDGGDDGLDFYRRIAIDGPKYLKKGGTIFLEIGQGQFKDVEKLLLDGGASNVTSKKDYAKITRVVIAKYDKRK